MQEFSYLNNSVSHVNISCKMIWFFSVRSVTHTSTELSSLYFNSINIEIYRTQTQYQHYMKKRQTKTHSDDVVRVQVAIPRRKMPPVFLLNFNKLLFEYKLGEKQSINETPQHRVLYIHLFIYKSQCCIILYVFI